MTRPAGGWEEPNKLVAENGRPKGGQMEIVVKGRNISVTEAVERYAWEKVERVR